MKDPSIFILGAGSIGMPLAVHLGNAGRRVTAVRTGAAGIAPHPSEITISGSGGNRSAAVDTVSLSELRRLDGTIVVAAKSYANDSIASRLREMDAGGPIVILQNGVGVEDPYLALDGSRVYRCVLYATGQRTGENAYTFRPVTASPIGVVRGTEEELSALVDTLNSPGFPFVTHPNIKQEVWKKATINCVFNSICTLLEIDNGIFVRDESVARLAREVVDECTAVAQRMGLPQDAEDVMRQLFAISRGSDGQLISTLQDINHGRETEIDYLNLAIARVAAEIAPDVSVTATRVLGDMVKIKSMLRRKSS